MSKCDYCGTPISTKDGFVEYRCFGDNPSKITACSIECYAEVARQSNVKENKI